MRDNDKPMTKEQQKIKFQKTRGRAEAAWRKSEAAWQRVERSTAGDVYSRLGSVDFMNQALLLAGVMLLWLFPNLIFLSAVAGKNFSDGIAAKMGLNSEATHIVENLFKPSAASVVATVGAVLFLIMAVLATVAVIQKLWQTIWGLDGLGYWHESWQQFLWGFSAIGVSAALTYIQHELNPVYPGLAA